jgi:hypothetical protein
MRNGKPRGVPQDEWRLAISLADALSHGAVGVGAAAAAEFVPGTRNGKRAAFEGAIEQRFSGTSFGVVNLICGRLHPSHYAVGAALWEALNS